LYFLVKDFILKTLSNGNADKKEMIVRGDRIKCRTRRAVAPIIATLLMIAIAVVGGVMIYVFTQGFFSSTTTTGIASDTIIMTGYDAREPTMTDHFGESITEAIDTSTSDGKLEDEIVALYLKNSGPNEASIAKLEVNGLTFVVDSTTDLSVALTAAGKYSVLHQATPGGTQTIGGTSLSAGEEVTVLLSMHADTETLSGRTISTEITTGTGSTFTYGAVVGQKK